MNMDLKCLNGMEFSESEIEDYMQKGSLTENQINSITNNIKTKLAKEKLDEAYKMVKKELRTNEKIEEVIKGTDTEAILSTALIGVMAKGALIASYDYSVDKLVFITSERLIIVNTNHYNMYINMKSYELDEVKTVKLGKKVRRKYSLIGMIGVTIWVAFMSLVLAMITNYALTYIFPTAEYINSVGVSIILAAIYAPLAIKINPTNIKDSNKVSIETSDAQKYELTIINKNSDDIKNRLGKLNKNI